MTGEKMHVDEVPVDAALVRRLLAEQFPEWAGLSIHPVTPWGTDNAVYRLGDDMVARLPRTPRTSRTLEVERQWLPRLAPQLPLAIPLPLADGIPGEGYPFPWSVYRWLPGENATTEHITDTGRLAADLARLIAALQRIDPEGGPPPGEVNSFRGVPLARRDAGTRAAIAFLADEIDVAAVTAAWDEALGAPEWRRPPVWLHGDLDSRNLLAENGRLSAVIDFGTLGVGDPACDVTVAWKMLSGEARDAFRTALSVDEATWARSRGWALSQAVTALAYYTEQTNAVLVREAKRWIVELLADHDPTVNGEIAGSADNEAIELPEREPTIYPELNEILRKLVTDACSILRDEFVGAYLQGSFALRDADEHSDVDFVVVTRNKLNDARLDQLQSMHKRIYEAPVPWAQHLEGSYIPAESLRVVDPGAKYVFLDNGATELEWDEHCNTALVRWILREHGIVLAGPDQKGLIDPVSGEQLRTEALKRVREYAEWAPEPTEAGQMSRWKQNYLVLTFCRLLHTIRTGTVATKSKAAEWALHSLDPEWADLIRAAVDDRSDPWKRVHQAADPKAAKETLLFADYAERVAAG